MIICEGKNKHGEQVNVWHRDSRIEEYLVVKPVYKVSK